MKTDIKFKKRRLTSNVNFLQKTVDIILEQRFLYNEVQLMSKNCFALLLKITFQWTPDCKKINDSQNFNIDPVVDRRTSKDLGNNSVTDQ